jgi:hypothetical protein
MKVQFLAGARDFSLLYSMVILNAEYHIHFHVKRGDTLCDPPVRPWFRVVSCSTSVLLSVLEILVSIGRKPVS